MSLLACPFSAWNSESYPMTSIRDTELTSLPACLPTFDMNRRNATHAPHFRRRPLSEEMEKLVLSTFFKAGHQIASSDRPSFVPNPKWIYAALSTLTHHSRARAIIFSSRNIPQNSVNAETRPPYSTVHDISPDSCLGHPCESKSQLKTSLPLPLAPVVPYNSFFR
ncbi:hypothetical protein GALMADRAFT_136336 [Galerina marginata CBS 339.88]|uniref:Uncharacterized protein n=1 Tax=Galerina marginata (strain CBS 339.88) TaxID=685588 RepID=A0A067TN41_GALM3|nr:hypothetical protein GALMADRAFT_136336 [Galerina marginata CBS 339.88]